MDQGPGFYGKLPAVGDFVQRRLPPAFIAGWDRWLQDSMLAARAALGPGWRAHFVATPPWRFVLAPGVVTAHGWIGLLLPSHDRVGRHFPLTLAQACPAADLLATLERADAWFGALERLAQEARDAGLALSEFDARLARLGAAPWVPAPASAEDPTTPLGGGRPARALAHWDGGRAACERAARTLAGLRRPGCVLVGGAMPTLLALELLPAPALAVALLDGRWDAHGWCVDDGTPGRPAGHFHQTPAPAAAHLSKGNEDGPVRS